MEQAMAASPAKPQQDELQPAAPATPASPSSAAAAAAAAAAAPNGSASKPKVKKSGSFLTRLFHRHSKGDNVGATDTAASKYTLTDARTVKLVKNGQSLGMKVKTNDGSTQVFVSELTAGGLADQSGKIRVNDVIVSINGEDMTNATHDDVVNAIKKQEEVELVVASAIAPAPMTSVAAVVDAVVEASHMQQQQQQRPAMPNSPGSAASVRSEAASPAAAAAAATGVPIETHTISIIRGGAGFGFKFKTKEAKKKGSVKSRLTAKALLSGARVISVAEGSNAASAGLVTGDIIFEINGKRIDTMRHKDVAKEVKTAEVLTLAVHTQTEAERMTAAKDEEGEEGGQEVDPSLPMDPAVAENLHTVQEQVVRAVQQKAADAAMDEEKFRRTTEGQLAGVSAALEDKKTLVQEQLLSSMDRKAAAAAASEEQARLVTENKMQQVASQLLSEADRKLASQMEHEEQERRIKSPDAIPPTTIVAHHAVEQELKQRSPEKPASAEGVGRRAPGASSDIRVVSITRDSPASALGLKLKSVDELPGTYVSEIIKGGLAEKTGQFNVGDRILKINSQDVTTAQFDDVVAMLRTSANLEFAIRADDQLQQVEAANNVTSTMASMTDAAKSTASSAMAAASGAATSLMSSASSAMASAVAPAMRTVVLQRGQSGLGMKVKSEEDRPGIMVNELTPGGVAQCSGQVHPNDYILAINGHQCTGLDHDAVVGLLTSQDQVTLLLSSALPADIAAAAAAAANGNNANNANANANNKTDAMTTAINSAVAAAAAAVASKSAVLASGSDSIADRFTNLRSIKLERGSSGLGMKIMSHDESNGVRVCQVIEGGVADRSGQIARGDYILKINGRDMLFADHDTVVSALKESTTVTLDLATDPKAPPVSEPSRRTVVVERGGKPLGMKVLFVSGEPGISISEITPGGLADKSQQLQLHERILAVNGKEIGAPPIVDEAAVIDMFRTNERLELLVEPSPRSQAEAAAKLAAANAAAAVTSAANSVAASATNAVNNAAAAATSAVASATSSGEAAVADAKKKTGSRLGNLFGSKKKSAGKDDLVKAAEGAMAEVSGDANKMVATLEKELTDSRETIASQARKIQEMEAQLKAAKSNAAATMAASPAPASSPTKAELVDLQVKLADAEMSRATQQAATEGLNAELKSAREEIKKLRSALEQAGISTGEFVCLLCCVLCIVCV